MTPSGTLVGQGWAAPPPVSQAALWREFFADFYDGHRVAERVFARSGVLTRHGVADPRVEDVSSWSTAARMQRFVAEALPLGKEAVTACLADAGLAPAAVDQLTVVSCTGYATPGLDVLLARDLGFGPATQRLHIGHMGCYAALPALATAADAAGARTRTSVVLCLELTSLHIQPATDEPEQMVAHALFSDAAAAVAVRPEPAPGGLRVVDVTARTASDHAGLMTWDVTDLGFRMGLSPEVPAVLAQHVEGAMADLLHPHGLTCSDVAAWAVHPGGPRIVDVVGERLGLDGALLDPSRAVLAEHGNCSSATVLRILDRLTEAGTLQAGDPVVAMAFGPGLTLYAVLLQAA